MICQRVKYPVEIGRCGRYRYKRTSGHDSGITIFIQKRFLGFLWWTFVKDEDGCPITYNKKYNAEAFMQGKIKYYDNLSFTWTGHNSEAIVESMTDELAWQEISKIVERKSGEIPELECVQKAWELDTKKYCHVAADYAELWQYIYKQNGKKLWLN